VRVMDELEKSCDDATKRFRAREIALHFHGDGCVARVIHLASKARRPDMKAQLTLIASALLLVSNIAGAQEQQAPSDMMQGQSMMGHGMMGHGMMGHGMMGHGMGMRIMVILMDTDGDGALSLEEVQTAHARIFKAIDADKDGKVTLEEMQMFFRGGSSTSDQ
jgi:hypothetical protein